MTAAAPAFTTTATPGVSARRTRSETVGPATASTRRAGAAYAVLNAVAAALILVIAAPVLLLVAHAVKLDGGPVFFRQIRVGEDGREFSMIKFRSMVVDAERKLAALTARNEAAGPLFKMVRDPRITPVGQFIRRFSLDELPQLFHVLGGTMALVGPRPALPREVAVYCPLARRRLAAKPGLTGLWQVSGRSNLTWDESIRLDATYVATWSPALDAKILFRTIGAVLRGGGAY
jgi:lipopolysaccharide/colanic/teichoic acid biosynthesis glycosyltransferase